MKIIKWNLRIADLSLKELLKKCTPARKKKFRGKTHEAILKIINMQEDLLNELFLENRKA